MKFRKDHAEVNSKANLPALSIATHLTTETAWAQTAPALGTTICSFISPASIDQGISALCFMAAQSWRVACRRPTQLSWRSQVSLGKGAQDPRSTKADIGVPLPAGMLPQ